MFDMRYIFRLFGSSSYTKVIRSRSRSRSQERKCARRWSAAFDL